MGGRQYHSVCACMLSDALGTTTCEAERAGEGSAVVESHEQAEK